MIGGTREYQPDGGTKQPAKRKTYSICNGRTRKKIQHSSLTEEKREGVFLAELH